MSQKDKDYQRRLLCIKEFYLLLSEVESRIGGRRLLNETGLHRIVPKQGIYFFFEPGEIRSNSGEGQRVVRVGTHGITEKSKATLWERLRTHRGYKKGRFLGGGNHRGSVLRKLLGSALIKRNCMGAPGLQKWGKGFTARPQIRELEYPLEIEVSKYICSMPFVWIPVRDAPRAKLPKDYIERNSIALLSNYNYQAYPIDPASDSWLGYLSGNDAICASGLWNIAHVSDNYDVGFLNEMERIIHQEKEY